MNPPSSVTSLATRCALALALTAMAHAAQAAGPHAGSHDESAIGEPGKAASVTRTVRIDMSDTMRFSPSSIAAKQGETVRFAWNTPWMLALNCAAIGATTWWVWRSGTVGRER